jgi:hypothetical protein
MFSHSLYVYGLVRTEGALPITAPGIGGPEKAVSLVPCGRIAALASAADVPEIMPLRRHMLAHTRVLEEAMIAQPVLPMRFGIIVETAAALQAVVGPRERELVAMLDDLEGRIEVGIKASWNETLIWREIAATHPQIARAAHSLRGRGEQQTYYDRIDLGREVEAALADKRAMERQRLIDAVAPFAVRLIELPPSDDMMFAHCALLVDQVNEPALFHVVSEMERFQQTRLTLRYVAPIPPYNFVAVTLDWAPAATARMAEAR